jgi:hypothetical protein
VLAFVGEGTEIALMLVRNDVCTFVCLLRGWQEDAKEVEQEDWQSAWDCSYF